MIFDLSAIGAQPSPANYAPPSDEMGSLKARRRKRKARKKTRKKLIAHMERMSNLAVVPRNSEGHLLIAPTASAGGISKRRDLRLEAKAKSLSMGKTAQDDGLDDLPEAVGGRPAWVIPAAVGGGVLVLVGGALLLKKKKKG